MEENLRGVLGFKGERGDSAYETAILNGFVGTEQDWLATLGTSSHFNEESIIHTSTAGQTSFTLPDSYTSNSFIDVYVNGLRLNSNEYTINTSTNEINLVGVTLTANQTVEIVVLTMATNALPIVETINAQATNNTAAGTKAVYDLVNPISTSLKNTNENVVTLTNKVNTLTTNTNQSIATINTNLAKKANASDFATLTGSIASIGAGATKTADIAYPPGFTKDNTIIISKMSSNNNVYYDNLSLEDTASGYPTISMVALTDSTIRVWLKNNNVSEARIGYYKIGIMKV
jgi:hypothetical protein